MRKAFAIWLMAGLPVLADSVAATRSWVSNRVAEARAEWRGDVAAATNPVPSWISAAEGRVDARIGSATNSLPEKIASVTNGLPERIASVTNGLPAKMAALTNGLPEAIAGSTNGLPERIASVTNGLPERIASVTNGLPELIVGATNGLPERLAAVTSGVPALVSAATNGVMEEVNAATGSLWRAIGNIEGVTADIGALARTNDLPTKVSQLENDAGYLTNHVDVSNLARAAGVFPDWTSKGTWSGGEFCTWKGVVYRFTGAGDPSAQPDISPVSWAVSDVGTAIAEARPDMSSLTNPIPAWIAASTNGLPERIASVTNGLPERIAASTNGLPERIASVTNGLPERIAAVTNGLPEAIVASTNPIPSWIAAATGDVPARVSALVQSAVSGLDGKAATRLVSADGYRWIDGTGAVWQVGSAVEWNGERIEESVYSEEDSNRTWMAESWWCVYGRYGSVTGGWYLVRNVNTSGTVVVDYIGDGLPGVEGIYMLAASKVYVHGAEVTPSGITSNGWYGISDGVDTYTVSPLVTTVTVARVTNYVDRLALSGEILDSGAIASVVTNTVTKAYVEDLGIDITVDSALSLTSTNPVQNKVVTAALGEKLSRAEAEAGFTEWVVRNHGSIITNAEIRYFPQTEFWEAEVDGNFVEGIYGSSDETYLEFPESGRYFLTATRTRIPTWSDITNITTQLACKASTNDVQLTPVYSQTPTFSDEWTFSGVPDGAKVLDFKYLDDANTPHWNMVINFEGSLIGEDCNGDTNAVSLTFTFLDDTIGLDATITATRTRTDIIGYTLGTQTNNVLVSTNAIPSVPVKAVKRNGTALTPDANGAVNVLVPTVSNTYDFSTNVGLYTAVRDIILALGGSVTNFPTISQGGN